MTEKIERISLPGNIRKIFPELRGTNLRSSQQEKILQKFHQVLDDYKKAYPDKYPDVLSFSILGLLEMKKGNEKDLVVRIDSALRQLITDDSLYEKEGVVENLIARYSNMAGITKFEKGLFLEKIFLQIQEKDSERGRQFVYDLIEKYKGLYYDPDVEYTKANIADLGTVVTGYYPTTTVNEKWELYNQLFDHGIDYTYEPKFKEGQCLVEFSTFEISRKGIQPDPYDHLIANGEDISGIMEVS